MTLVLRLQLTTIEIDWLSDTYLTKYFACTWPSSRTQNTAQPQSEQLIKKTGLNHPVFNRQFATRTSKQQTIRELSKN